MGTSQLCNSNLWCAAAGCRALPPRRHDRGERCRERRRTRLVVHASRREPIIPCCPRCAVDWHERLEEQTELAIGTTVERRVPCMPALGGVRVAQRLHYAPTPPLRADASRRLPPKAIAVPPRPRSHRCAEGAASVDRARVRKARGEPKALACTRRQQRRRQRR